MTDNPALADMMTLVDHAIEPLTRKIEKLESDAVRVAADLKASDERRSQIAMDDRLRVADLVKQGSEKQASEVAEKVVRQMMVSLGLDPEKPGDFVRDMMFLRELRETFGAAKRHGILVFMGVIVMGVAAAVWAYVRAGIVK